MHSFFLAGAIVHATLVAVIAFFILFAAGKSGGFTKILGSILGYWVLIIALIILAGGVSAQMNGGKPFGMEPMMWGHHGKHCDGDKTDMMTPVTPATPPAAMTAPATPKK
jgi:hypothetical protein